MTENYEIFCIKCDWKLTIRNVSLAYAKRVTDRFSEMKTKGRKCIHIVDFKEVT